MKKIFFFLFLLLFGGTLWFTIFAQKESSDKIDIGNSTKENTKIKNQNTHVAFKNPKKTPHYESNTPEHGAVFAGVPLEIVVNFNFDLADRSSISVASEGKEYGVDKTTIDSNRLTLRRMMDSNASDGTYTVRYDACWPDRTCHDGNFQFTIDRSKAEQFLDQRGKKEVSISIQDFSFDGKEVWISRGTNVMWTNDGQAQHYVNTDSHPAHTYVPSMNSKLLQTGDRFTIVFDRPGVYPYHCSAHPAEMQGIILVE